MLEKIPDYSQGNNPPHQTAAGVDLAPVVITPSLCLYRLEVFVYVFMLASASVAIFPFLVAAFYWPFLWIIFLLMVLLAIRKSMHARKARPFVLSVTQKVWHLRMLEGDIVVKPCNEILVWAKLIVVPVQEIASGRKHRIIALPDSMKADDWRRLRVWLRMALHKNS